MKIFSKSKILAAGALLALCSCDEGSTGNPATASRSDLNPTGPLYSVTQSGSIQLGWTTGNAEEDFKGYLVFGTTTPLADLTASIIFPEGASGRIGELGVPRCKANSAFFEKFGLPATEKDCDGNNSDTTEDDSTAELTQFFATAKLMQDSEEETGDTTKEEALENFLDCAERTSDVKVSLDPKIPVTTAQKCTVSKVYDPVAKEMVSIVDGTAMTFVVFAVMGDDYDTISWSSNALEDAASTTLLDSADLVLPAKKFQKLTFTVGDTVTAAFDASASDCTILTNADNNYCYVSRNNENTDEAVVYVSRNNIGTSNGQRIFVSIPSGGAGQQSTEIQLQARGPQTLTTDDGGVASRIAGDQATDTYDNSGITFVVSGNQVFDFKIKNGTSYNYGKIVFESISYSDAADQTSDATLKVTVIAQPGKDLRHYFW